MLNTIIQDLFDFHNSVNFPDTRFKALPPFEIAENSRGSLVVFAGVVGDTQTGQLLKALELFSNHANRTLIFRGQFIAPESKNEFAAAL